MGVIRFSLKYPNTFLVVAVLTLFLGGSAAVTTPKDIFPNIDIPVISIIWTYTGLSAPETEQRITTYTEYALSNFVNDIKNIESQTLVGVAVEKVYFQPNVNIATAMSEVTASTNAIRPFLPPGVNPPIVVQYSASSVPVLQVSLSSNKMSEAQLYDYGMYRLRQEITSVPGSIVLSPYGGKPRQIMVDIDLHALQALGLRPEDVTKAVNAENLTVPSGQAKIGNIQYQVRLNATPDAVRLINDTPIKEVNGTMIYVRDVAHVRDGAPVQQNIVRTEGRRSALVTILKNGDASTLDVVNTIKNKVLPVARAAAPKGLKIQTLFDQSVFVSKAISDVMQEGAIAAALTGLMIFVFLGSWRSTLVVLVSIPLSILASLVVLSALGETINIMTLGGLALAVGILVDDATVAIENTYQELERGRKLREAVVAGISGIAKPILISTLAICAAFVSVVFLTGAAKFLFTPQAMAIVFAMIAAYGFSLTSVPILIDFLLRGERNGDKEADASAWHGWLARFNAWFNGASNGSAPVTSILCGRY
jgi:multidrug efflux pump subunit AcrB